MGGTGVRAEQRFPHGRSNSLRRFGAPEGHSADQVSSGHGERVGDQGVTEAGGETSAEWASGPRLLNSQTSGNRSVLLANLP